jgi:hypothetical protein
MLREMVNNKSRAAAAIIIFIVIIIDIIKKKVGIQPCLDHSSHKILNKQEINL